MFKWTCLGVAVVGVVVLLWMVDDIRRQVRASSGPITEVGESVSENLPALTKRTQKVAERAELIAERAESVAEVMAELAEDIRQLKELAGAGKPRDMGLIGYANSALTAIEAAGGRIGVRKNLPGLTELKNTRPVAEWTPGARKEALFMSLLVSSKKDMARKIATTKLGFDWWIEVGGKKTKLLEWMKANHPETKELGW